MLGTCLRRRNLEIAKRSMAVASAFGFLASIGSITLGDESGYFLGEHQPMKMASIEAMWHTEPRPASFNVIKIT